MYRFPFKKFSSTIFIRLLFTYIIVIIPIVVLGLYLYHWSYENARDEISRSTTSQLEYYLDDLNREIEWLELQLYSFLEDNNLRKVAITWDTMSQVDKHDSITYITNRLTSFKTSSQYIEDIKLYIPDIDKSISATQGMISFEYEADRLLDHYLQSRMDRLYIWDDHLSLIGLKYGVTGTMPLYVMQIRLNHDQIANSLQQISIYPESGAFIYLSSNFKLASLTTSDGIIANYFMRDSESINELKYDNVNYHINTAYSDLLKLTVVSYIPEDTVKNPLKFFSQWVWIFVIVTLIAIIIVYYSTYRLIHKPMLLLIKGFRSMEDGNFNHPIKHDKQDDFGFIYERFNMMLFNLKGLIEQDYKQKMMMQRSELKQLQSQINPHFLYNSFFILNSLAQVKDVERIEQFTIMLGEYFRFITRNSNDLVTLSEEIKHSRVYTEIQELRFSRRIKVDFHQLPQQFETLKVPRLIIQPIIENAYEHSLENMDSDGLLSITFNFDNQYLYIIVEDNGGRLSNDDVLAMQAKINEVATDEEITGILNIHRRLALTFGYNSGVILKKSDGNGLRVTLKIYIA